MAKLKYIPNPTFKFGVKVPVPGEQHEGEIVITFRHLTPQALAEATNKAGDRIALAAKEGTDEDSLQAMADCLKEIAVDWEWDEEFSVQNIKGALLNYPRLYDSIVRQVGEELWAVRAKR